MNIYVWQCSDGLFAFVYASDLQEARQLIISKLGNFSMITDKVVYEDPVETIHDNVFVLCTNPLFFQV